MPIESKTKTKRKQNIKKMKKQTLRSLFRLGIFTTLSTLRLNENGYPYVTLLGTNAKSETISQNVYFGKISGGKILGNYAVGDDITKELKEAEIGQTINNTNGETRFKIFFGGQTAYASTATLEDMWGEAEDADFDMDQFKTGFAAKVEANNQNSGDKQEPIMSAKGNGK